MKFKYSIFILFTIPVLITNVYAGEKWKIKKYDICDYTQHNFGKTSVAMKKKKSYWRVKSCYDGKCEWITKNTNETGARQVFLKECEYFRKFFKKFNK